ncbi:MAG: zinc ribbon domain-containing protein [Lactococcus garvieae]
MAKALKTFNFLNNKRTFTIPESVGLSEEEKNRIITSPKFDDFVINIESLNFVFLRDEREVQANVYIKTEKEVLYGQTLKFPYPKSTNFYDLLEKFNTKKRRAIDVEELEQKEKGAITASEIPNKQTPYNDPLLVRVPSERSEEGDIPAEDYSSPEEKMSYGTIAEAFGDSEKMDDKAVQEEPLSEIEEEEQDSELKECENCGFENESTAKFCSECGANLVNIEQNQNIGQGMSKAVQKEMLQAVSEETEQETFIVDPKSEYQSSSDDMHQLLKVKDGLKDRAQIEKDVALEFEGKKTAAIRAADEKVEAEKQKELEELERTFNKKQELARTEALETLSIDEKAEVDSRVEAMKNYLKRVYEAGLRSIEEGVNMKSAND